MKKLISLLTFVVIVATSATAQKVIKFKTSDGKKAKVTIPGKLLATLTDKDEAGKTEYYVDFDTTNKQVVIAMVSYSGKAYLGSDVTCCKYDAFDLRFLINIPMQERSTDGTLTIDTFYSFSFSAKNKFQVKSCNSITGEESATESGDAVIRFDDKETAQKFINKVKQKVGV